MSSSMPDDLVPPTPKSSSVSPTPPAPSASEAESSKKTDEKTAHLMDRMLSLWESISRAMTTDLRIRDKLTQFMNKLGLENRSFDYSWTHRETIPDTKKEILVRDTPINSVQFGKAKEMLMRGSDTLQQTLGISAALVGDMRSGLNELVETEAQGGQYKAENLSPAARQALAYVDLELAKKQFALSPPDKNMQLSKGQFDKAKEILGRNSESFLNTLGISADQERQIRGQLSALVTAGSQNYKISELPQPARQALAYVNLELIEDQFDLLADMFNDQTLAAHNQSMDAWAQDTLQGASAISSDLFTMNQMKMMEVLSNALAYTEGLNGKSISLPVRGREGYEMVEYRIEEIALGKDGLPAYVLKPKTGAKQSLLQAQPYIVVRGSERISGLSQQQEQLPGEPIRKVAATELLREFGDNSSPILVGSGAGATLISEMYLENPTRIGAAYAFNPSGVSQDKAAKWTEVAERGQGSKLIAILTEGDARPGGGTAIIGNGIVIDKGTSAYITDSDFTMRRLNPKAENSKVGRKVLEVLKRMQLIGAGARSEAGAGLQRTMWAGYKQAKTGVEQAQAKLEEAGASIREIQKQAAEAIEGLKGKAKQSKIEEIRLEMTKKIDQVLKGLDDISWKGIVASVRGHRIGKGLFGMIGRGAARGDLLWPGWIHRATVKGTEERIVSAPLPAVPEKYPGDYKEDYEKAAQFNVYPKAPFEKEPITTAQKAKAQELIAARLKPYGTDFDRLRIPQEGGVRFLEPTVLPVTDRVRLFNIVQLTNLNLEQFQQAMKIESREEAIEKKKELQNLVSDLADLDAFIKLSEKDEQISSEKMTGAITRADFKTKHWRALDKVNFALIQDQFARLNRLFNTDTFMGQSLQMQTWAERWGIEPSLFTMHQMRVSEILARALAYTEGLHGQTIDIPVMTEDDRCELVKYKILDTAIGNKSKQGDSLPGYVLEPQLTDKQKENKLNASPYLVARGTEIIFGSEDGKEYRTQAAFSRVTDTSPDSASRRLVHHYGGELEKLIKGWKTDGKKPILVGHSLGGALVGDMFLRHPDDIEGVYAFNPPGTGKDEEDFYNTLPKEQAGKLISILREGDAVSGGGAALIGRGVVIEGSEKKALEAHLDYIDSNFTMSLLDRHTENNTRSRKVLEFFREVGSIFLGGGSQERVVMEGKTSLEPLVGANGEGIASSPSEAGLPSSLSEGIREQPEEVREELESVQMSEPQLQAAAAEEKDPARAALIAAVTAPVTLKEWKAVSLMVSQAKEERAAFAFVDDTDLAPDEVARRKTLSPKERRKEIAQSFVPAFSVTKEAKGKFVTDDSKKSFQSTFKRSLDEGETHFRLPDRYLTLPAQLGLDAHRTLQDVTINGALIKGHDKHPEKALELLSNGMAKFIDTSVPKMSLEKRLALTDQMLALTTQTYIADAVLHVGKLFESRGLGSVFPMMPENQHIDFHYENGQIVITRQLPIQLAIEGEIDRSSDLMLTTVTRINPDNGELTTTLDLVKQPLTSLMEDMTLQDWKKVQTEAKARAPGRPITEIIGRVEGKDSWMTNESMESLDAIIRETDQKEPPTHLTIPGEVDIAGAPFDITFSKQMMKDAHRLVSNTTINEQPVSKSKLGKTTEESDAIAFYQSVKKALLEKNPDATPGELAEMTEKTLRLLPQTFMGDVVGLALTHYAEKKPLAEHDILFKFDSNNYFVDIKCEKDKVTIRREIPAEFLLADPKKVEPELIRKKKIITETTVDFATGKAETTVAFSTDFAAVLSPPSPGG